jgi:uncharacterized repeat protein (TIGR01451 family)
MGASIRSSLAALGAAASALFGAAAANECATPAAQGSGTISGVVNTYYPATSNLGTGGTSITLGTATGASTPIASGDLVLIIQMQDASIDRTNTGTYGDGVSGDPDNGANNLRNSGRFAFARATSAVPLAGGTLTIAASTGVAFTNAASSGTAGQRRYQVVRVPQYNDVTISGTLTASAWNGTSGGVVAIDVAGTLTMSAGTISVDGLGFRGGGGRQLAGGSGVNTDRRTNATNNANASKGEGVAGAPRYLLSGGALLDTGVEGYPNGSYARGAPGNAGGGGTDGNPAANDQNTGGGGGAGFGAGGRGGHAWCGTAPTGCPQTGGWGGAGVTSQGVNRLIMGGGGGAGTSNNGTGTPGAGLASSGAAGGGMVIIRAGEITGSGTIRANGANANNSVGNDSNGGGGAGGAILVTSVTTPTAALTFEARGGNGGSNTGGGSAHGPGGGGGGGFVATSWGASADISGGSAGTTVDGGTFGASYGAAGGSIGSSTSISGASVPGLSSGAECTPAVTKSFSPDPTTAGTPSRLTLTIFNRNPTTALAALALSDAYPSGLVNRTPPGVTNACGGSVTAAAGAGSIALSGGSLGAGANCAIGVDVVAASSGSYANTVNVGGVTATIGGRAVQNLDAATDTLVVNGAMSAGKTATVVSDPVNGATSPFAIPGSVIEYLISFTNPGAGAIDAGTIVIRDAIPANTNFINQDIAGAGSGPVVLVDSSPASGLALGSGTVTYSNNNGATFTYTPTAGVDPNVTTIRVNPTGAMAAGRTVSVRFRVVVE